MKDENISGALAENILTLLCFDDKFCSIVRSSITASLFESAVFRDIASHAIDFIDQFGEAIKEHLPDSLEGVLAGNDKRKAASFQRVIDNLFMAREHVNSEYVVAQLHKFVRQQNLKSAVIRSVEALESGDIDRAEIEITKGLNSQVSSFETGVSLWEPKQSLAFFDHVSDGIHIGIPELDSRDIGPRPQEMLTFVAPPKKGKSWGLVHVGKHCMIQRKKVLHVTLEMSEARTAQRYVQALFSISKREANVRTTRFVTDNLGRLIDFEEDQLNRPTLMDPGIRDFISKKLESQRKRRAPLIIKQFPTGALTVTMLKAYLDGLERFQKFVPDVVIIDYPDLMKLDSDNLRISTGQIYKDLRGIAVERNLAMVVASQGNREAATAKMVTDSMIAEDYSKIATSDNVLTYTQTEEEKKLGLARLYVANGRNDEDKFVVLVSQSYAIGQFCLSSTYMHSDYWDRLKGAE